MPPRRRLPGPLAATLRPGSRPPPAPRPGTRTPERKEGAPAAAPHLPRSARPRCRLAPRPQPPRPPEPRAHRAGPNSKEPGAGEEAPPREPGAGAGGAGAGAGRGRECYNFLPCPPPAARPRDAGGEGAGAPMSSLSFSPPLSPSLRPPAPPASSEAADQAGPEFSGLGPRAGGRGRRGRRREASRAGRGGPRGAGPGSGIQDRNCAAGGGRAGPSVPEPGRVHVSVCVCGSVRGREARRGEEPTMRFPRCGSRESPIAGRAGPGCDHL
ncbi:uncharacterized protein LOC128931659 [Callithrix jacchus]